jgi:hypothetical protein
MITGMESGAASSALPLILIEVVLIFGGVLAFGWWQLHSVKRDRAKMLAERAQRASAETADAADAAKPTGAPAAGGAVGTGTAPDHARVARPMATAADPDPAPSTPRSSTP